MHDIFRRPVLALIAILVFSLPTYSQTAEPQAVIPAPTADSTPDLSGLWMRLRDKGATTRGYGSYILDFGNAVSPMTSWAATKFKTTNAMYHGADAKTVLSDPIFQCYPPGVPRIYLMNFPVQIVQIPGQVLMLFEYDHFIRRIYTDGRPHDRDQGPLWMGDTVGKWEGDTLVADTASFNDKTLLDRVGHPHSDALHVIERFRRPDFGHMEVQVTIDDPKAYIKPWTAKIQWEYMPDTELLDWVCENEKDFQHLVGK